MKARVKATGDIIEIDEDCSYVYAKNYDKSYALANLEFLDVKENENPDYREKLLHLYTGMAMNALLLTNNIRNGDLEGMRECNTNAMAIASALVNKLKEEK